MFKVVFLPGDGIGPEVIEEARKVFEFILNDRNHKFEYRVLECGGISIDKYGVALTDEVLNECKKSHAVILGSVGGPKWDDPDNTVKPTDALIKLRKELQVFANLRPIKVFSSLINSSPLKKNNLEIVDLMILRELTGGIYFGKPKEIIKTNSGLVGIDTMVYNENEIRRIIRAGFELASNRKGILTSVDKANMLESSRLWRKIAKEIHLEYPNVRLEHVLVDACSMMLINKPENFDVIVTGNIFGDILSDEASVLCGTIGVLPSASLSGIPKYGEKIFGLYEPVHGSANDIENQCIANPIGAILSVSMMFKYSFGLIDEANLVYEAVDKTLKLGYRTKDMKIKEEETVLSTTGMGKKIVDNINQIS